MVVSYTTWTPAHILLMWGCFSWFILGLLGKEKLKMITQ